MSEYDAQKISDLRSKLLMKVAVANERSRAGEKWAADYQANIANLAAVNKAIDELIECVHHIDDIYHNILHYSEEHTKTAQEILMRAIEEAAALVPDASAEGVHLHYEKDHAILVTRNEQAVNDREGGGYRSVLGVLLRYSLLKAQPGAQQFMLLDEQLFTLSDTTTALLKEVLDAMKRDFAIVVIEQRRNAADGIADKEYVFAKSESGIVTVTEAN